MQRAKKYTLEQVAALLPWPDDLANKYSRGKLTLIAGCADYPGAACLAAVASQRMGAGYTEVACSPESVAAASRAFDVRFADAAFYAASRFVFFCASDIRYSKGERIWMAF